MFLFFKNPQGPNDYLAKSPWDLYLRGEKIYGNLSPLHFKSASHAP